MSTDRKQKNLILSESEPEDDSEPESDSEPETELGLSLEKLNLGPKKKLLILCLGGLLVHRVHIRDMATVRGLRPDVVYGKFLGDYFILFFKKKLFLCNSLILFDF